MLNFIGKLVAAAFALVTPFLFETAMADQEEFQLRREQQLRLFYFFIRQVGK